MTFENWLRFVGRSGEGIMWQMTATGVWRKVVVSLIPEMESGSISVGLTEKVLAVIFFVVVLIKLERFHGRNFRLVSSLSVKFPYFCESRSFLL